jgi:hypothetical protein
MAQERLYRNNAVRQAAYRARHRDREPPRQSELAALARSLHGTLSRAVCRGESRLPEELLGERANETLRRLIRYLQAGMTPAEGSPERGGVP